MHDASCILICFVRSRNYRNRAFLISQFSRAESCVFRSSVGLRAKPPLSLPRPYSLLRCSCMPSGEPKERQRRATYCEWTMKPKHAMPQCRPSTNHCAVIRKVDFVRCFCDCDFCGFLCSQQADPHPCQSVMIIGVTLAYG